MGIFTQLKEKVAQYVNVYVKLFKINFIGRTSNIFSYFLFALICLFIFFCIILFIGFGLTEVFVEAGLSKMLSFFLVVVIYVLMLIMVVALRKRVTRIFAAEFIKILTEDDEKENNNEEVE